MHQLSEIVDVNNGKEIKAGDNKNVDDLLKDYLKELKNDMQKEYDDTNQKVYKKLKDSDKGEDSKEGEKMNQ